MPDQASRLNENSARGITLNKSLAWTVACGLIPLGDTVATVISVGTDGKMAGLQLTGDDGRGIGCVLLGV